MDHHFQIFTIGDLSDCKVLCLSPRTISVQAKTTVNAFANPDPLSKFLKHDLIHAIETYIGTPLFQNTYSQVEPGNLKTISTMIYLYPVT
jgi:hypothetical protein